MNEPLTTPLATRFPRSFTAGRPLARAHRRRTSRLRAACLVLLALLGTAGWPAWLRAETTIVAFGDSTTAPRGELEIYSRLLERELAGRGMAARIVNAGVGGNSTELARNRFERDVLARDPDVVVIQFGINDSAVDVWRDPPATQPRLDRKRFEQNLEYFVTTLRQRSARVLLMTPNPIRWTPKLKQLYGRPPYQPDQEDGFNVLLSDYAERVRAVAERHQVPLVDVYRAFQQYDRQPGQTMDELLLDGMHPNARGHRLVAELLLEHLGGEQE